MLLDTCYHSLSLCAKELTPTKDAELLNSFVVDIDLNKMLLPVVVITKAEKSDIYFYIPVYISKLFKDMQSGSKLCS